MELINAIPTPKYNPNLKSVTKRKLFFLPQAQNSQMIPVLVGIFLYLGPH